MEKDECTRFDCEGRLVPSTYLARRKVAGRRFELEVPATRCPECGRESIGVKEARKVSLHIAEDLALHGPPSGAAFRHLRKTMQLSAKEVAELLCLRPETVSRWEKGKRNADPRVVVLLGTIFLEHIDGKSTTFDRLQMLRA